MRTTYEYNYNNKIKEISIWDIIRIKGDKRNE